jgi:integrase
MPKQTTRLTDTRVRRASAKDRRYKLSDPGGLLLEIHPSGRKTWKFRYRDQAGKEQTETLGEYPAVLLSEAREKRDDIKRGLASGVTPKMRRETESEAIEVNTFEAIAREWHTVKIVPTLTPSHAKRQLRRLEMYIFPYLGDRPILELRPRDLLEVLRKIEDAGNHETCHRVKVICGQVFRYAIVTDRAERDISIDLRDALQPAEKKHLAAITEPEGVTKLLHAIDGYEGSYLVRNAIRLAPLVFLRPGELRHGEWSEVNFDKKVWEIAGAKMKMNLDHVVPLSDQSLAILQDQHRMTGDCRYIFPSMRSTDRPMSDNTLNAALRRMGFTKDEMTAHGFRALARTLLDEELGERVDLVEHQLAHLVKDPLGRAYNRTKFIKQRTAMMQRWADYLDRLRTKSDS